MRGGGAAAETALTPEQVMMEASHSSLAPRTACMALRKMKTH
jgi:hypothetical protein